jgi:hypothetical protein
MLVFQERFAPCLALLVKGIETHPNHINLKICTPNEMTMGARIFC